MRWSYYLIRFGGQPHALPHSSFSSFLLLPFISLFAGCLSWHCRVEPKVGDRIPGMKYDTLTPKDVEPYLNGRFWEDLKVGDEIAFPTEPDGSAPTAESLVGLTFCFQKGPDEKMEGACISFDANTKMHMVSLGGRTHELPLGTLPDEVKSKFTFEGSDAYFASADPEMMMGLCTIGELGVCSRCRRLGPFFGVTVCLQFEASRTLLHSSFSLPSVHPSFITLLFPFVPLPQGISPS
jgi:hypothetical protein